MENAVVLLEGHLLFSAGGPCSYKGLWVTRMVGKEEGGEGNDEAESRFQYTVSRWRRFALFSLP